MNATSPHGPGRTTARAWTLALAAALAVLATAFPPDLTRPGYSPDEEFTLVAVRGIQAAGLPMLPSGLLYDRGLAYSYASWAAGALFGQSLATYRALSLASGLGALAVLFRELRRLSSPAAAALAVALAATSVPFWVSATTARFYAPFLLFDLVALALLARPQLTWRGVAALVAASALARWNHELAFTLGGVPLIAGLVAGRGSRAVWARRLGWTCLGLVAGQAAILVVHRLAPPSNGDVMIQRFFVWQVLNLFERPPLDLVRALPTAAGAALLVSVALAAARRRADAFISALIGLGGACVSAGQLALPLVGALVAIPFVELGVRRRLAGLAVVVTAAGCAFWLVALTASGRGASDAVSLIVDAGFRYPLDMFTYIVSETPIVTACVLGAMLTRSSGLGGAWSGHERALHVLWMAWVLWFGAIASGITARYLLLPMTFMVSALAVDASAVLARARMSRPLAGAALILLAAAVTFESWRGPLGRDSRGEAARPTLVADRLAREIQTDDLLACTDEIACLLTAGRADVWLALDDFFRERFIVMRQGSPTGAYTGAPASFTLAPLLERATRDGRRLLVLDVLKDVPAFGRSDILVPRQLASEDLRGEVLAEVPGARLVHVVRAPVEAIARLQP